MRSRGFTLIELLVSLGVLTVALGTIAAVFSVTTKTASQAAAYAEAQAWLRQFSANLREDLKGIAPAESILVLRGRTVPAALDRTGLDARRFVRTVVGNPTLGDGSFIPDQSTSIPTSGQGSQYSNPRADLLMFISNRAQTSSAPPVVASPTLLEDTLQRGGRFAPVLIAYGHAAVARAELNGGQYWPEPESGWRHVNFRIPQNNPIISELPLQEWYLARRATLLIPNVNAPGLPNTTPYIQSSEWFASDGANSPALLLNLAGNGRLQWAVGGDSLEFNLSTFLSIYSEPADSTGRSPALVNPYAPQGLAPNFAEANRDLAWRSLLYASPAQSESTGRSPGPQLIATVIPNPPADLRSNLALQALPACGWFQVEFLQAENPRNSPRFFDGVQGVDNGPNRFDPPQWTPILDGKTYVFVPDNAANRRTVSSDLGQTDLLADQPRGWGCFGRIPQLSVPTGSPTTAQFVTPFPGLPDERDIRLWPYAIRITVRVYDPKGRLSEPLVQSVVHRFE